jgi:hypothetical protein
MRTLITSGLDYKLTEDDLDALSDAVRELGITSVVTLGFSAGLHKWATFRRLRVTATTNTAHAVKISEAAIIFPGKFMAELAATCVASDLEVWDWRGTSAEDKAAILADPEAALIYDEIVNGDREPLGYNADERGRVQEEKASA